MDNMTPLVSVIIPTHNAESHIGKTINSVRNQSFGDWELIVIDDCSQDSTCSIVERMMPDDNRIQLLKNETNMGVAQTRNRGLELCKGKYVAFLDADDIWYPDKLEQQIELAEKENADIVYSSYDIIDVDDKQTKSSYIVPKTVSYEELLRENVIGCSTVLITGKMGKKYRFTEEFYHEDYVMWLQILKDGYKAVGITDVLVKWRHLENARSFNKRKAAKNRWDIYRRCLKLSMVKSIYAFSVYAISGLKKYMKNV